MKNIYQEGSALIVGLVFLLILTILGTAGMRMARLELVIAGNEQFYMQALNAAESAVEKQIEAADFNVSYTSPSNPVTADTPAGISGQSTIRYLNEGMAPDGGFSDDVTTYRFEIDATGQAPAGANARANARIRQHVYVLAPAGSD